MGVIVADQLIEVLLQAGVRRIYGVVGDSLNPIVDAAHRATGIDWVGVRNEEAGAFAAAAEAQVTETLPVCAGSAGPGNTHLIQHTDLQARLLKGVRSTLSLVRW